ncbi:aspartate aminotransferase family protein [Zavarzinia sp. CC-PAN008]|uniref:aspartate aminotransferase family protein n=1 Tax=Zavarzinia sp. CC-PAN008 TaxID=3243332 RepID=UPI003F743444
MNAHTPLPNLELDAAIADARERYTRANPRSLARQEAAAASLPGGNTRGTIWYPPFPVAMAGGEGCRLTDIDGHTYVDFVSEYTAALYGHSHPVIAAALKGAIDKGILLGAPNTYEADLAAALVARFPAFERVRFCNSGTEANIMALSMARAITGRARILVFREGYHGGVLTFAKGGSPLNLPFPFEFGTYNDVEGTEAQVRALAPDLAAVILEPMMGGGGCIPASQDFLDMLRRETAAAGILLIFDEVMTSRLSPSGLQGKRGVTPDLATLGKYMGGGASFGGFGGRADLMDRFDPAQPGAFSHGGTFNNNVLSMAAGLAGITHVLTPEALTAMNAHGDALRTGMEAILAKAGIAACMTGEGSMMSLNFVPGPVTTPGELAAADPRLVHLWQIEMLLRGQYVTARGMMALSILVGAPEVEGFLAAFADFVETNASILPH